MHFLFKKSVMPSAEQALPGRTNAIVINSPHAVTGKPITGPFPDHLHSALFGMGCFWGAERKFWQQTGVYTTAVGYAGGFTPNPSYEEVCSGQTGHAEVVMVVYDPQQIDFTTLLTVFWESHDPTQGMQQGNDMVTQYRSVIYTNQETQYRQAQLSSQHYQSKILAMGHGRISTEIDEASVFYYAENEHQQYLAKNPSGYCGLGGLGISYE